MIVALGDGKRKGRTGRGRRGRRGQIEGRLAFAKSSVTTISTKLKMRSREDQQAAGQEAEAAGAAVAAVQQRRSYWMVQVVCGCTRHGKPRRNRTAPVREASLAVDTTRRGRMFQRDFSSAQLCSRKPGFRALGYPGSRKLQALDRP
jgi:hypothetical protein